MHKITEQNFIEEALKAVPEFHKTCKLDDLFDEEYGIEFKIEGFRIFADDTYRESNYESLNKISDFAIACYQKGNDQVQKFIIAEFFASLDKETLSYFSHKAPKDIIVKTEEFIKKWARQPQSPSIISIIFAIFSITLCIAVTFNAIRLMVLRFM